MLVGSAMESGPCGDRHFSSTDTPTVTRTRPSPTTSTISVEEQMCHLTDPHVAPPAAVAVADGHAPKASIVSAEEVRRGLPRRLSALSLDTAAESWDGCSDHAELHKDATETAVEEEEEEDVCIPYDYESEMEECSQYTFSNAPYSPSTTAALAAATSPPMDAATSSCRRPDTPRIPSMLSLPSSAAQSLEQEPLSPQWCERQRRDNASHHAGEHYAWQQGMRHATASAPSHMRYGLRSLVREACCREIQALRSKPAVTFVQMAAPQSESHTRSSMRASCMLASATSTAQRKACYIQIVTEHWKALEEQLEELLAETEKESAAASESHLRSVGYALNALSLFSNDPQLIIREMNMGHVEEQRRQRHDREAQLLMTLESQGRLFLLPALYAEEVEEPVPVLHIESVLTPNEKMGEYTHPWQLLSPDASLYSPSPSPTPDESIGAISPCSSGCISATCSPMLASQPPSIASTRLKVSRRDVWKDMQPPRLPLLDLFMTAPAVVPSTVPANSEVGVPYVMPVDPTYAQHELNRQGTLTQVTVADPLSSPQLSGATVRGGSTSARSSDDHRHPMLFDGTEDLWGSYVEEDVFDYAETIKLGDADVLLFSFEMNEAVTAAGPAAATRAILTDG
ncbi:conserved hypothetical protein [Leishmania infantum JPCM5]|uniref:Uncharacterized protein n=2 Tax=Leishmania infantum TaxID=5671 RepID=A4I8E7_LEIIN|nr:conserved hypothetical protein [Leishmania infantum JPCM5]CAC9527685.1 hypothetical_protein_-_conserved [Leishmania infantum]CAM71090.1 conserved hypothetical protein [Leishmania infantum JPCM5]SUZ44913.1 hypothetical_protein_-_conserved [Leishmania infantum]|eukprot:XP_001468016.1 conserved hypothetical protein [Leishmania infantum JPCM5]